MAKPVLASYTGGNKFVSNQSKGIVTFEKFSSETLANNILDLSITNKEELEKLGQINYNVYNSYYTVEAFAKRYREQVGRIFFGEG